MGFFNEISLDVTSNNIHVPVTLCSGFLMMEGCVFEAVKSSLCGSIGSHFLDRLQVKLVVFLFVFNCFGLSVRLFGCNMYTTCTSSTIM